MDTRISNMVGGAGQESPKQTQVPVETWMGWWWQSREAGKAGEDRTTGFSNRKINK